MQPEEKEKLRKGFWILFIIAVLVFSYYIFFVQPNEIAVKTINIETGVNNPVKIVFITDIHIETISDEMLEETIELANAQEADYVLLGGDYTDSISLTKDRLVPLQNLKSKNGIYAVLGNHDYEYQEMTCATMVNETGDEITQFFESMGIDILRNEKVDTGDFILVGVDDEWACKDDYENASDEVDFSRTTVLLTHDQEAIPKDELTKWDLILVGHTHCGQIRLPIIGSLPKLIGFKGKYDAGFYDLGNGSYLYNSCGIGGGPRCLTQPEITVIELS